MAHLANDRLPGWLQGRERRGGGGMQWGGKRDGEGVRYREAGSEGHGKVWTLNQEEFLNDFIMIRPII